MTDKERRDEDRRKLTELFENPQRRQALLDELLARRGPDTSRQELNRVVYGYTIWLEERDG